MKRIKLLIRGWLASYAKFKQKTEKRLVKVIIGSIIVGTVGTAASVELDMKDESCVRSQIDGHS